MAVDTQAQPGTGQGQDESTSEEVQAPAAPATQGTNGPWQGDLEAIFADESTRAQVDGFLREKVQPYVTQLEQSRSELEPAAQLYTDLQETPGDTYLALTEELFGAEAAQKIRSDLIALYGDPAAEETEQPEPTQATAPLDPRVERIVNKHEEDERRTAYDTELARVTDAAKESEAPVEADLFHPFVAAAEGDFDAAYQAYAAWLGQAKAKFAPATGTTEEPAAQQTAPPTLGGDASAPTVPPVQKEYTSLDDAVNDFLNENRPSAAPPTVGAT